jgi:hypothetical protein
MEKLSLKIAAEKNCTVKSYSNLTAVFTWIGLELGWKIYMHICSQSVLCMLRVMIRLSCMVPALRAEMGITRNMDKKYRKQVSKYIFQFI